MTSLPPETGFILHATSRQHHWTGTGLLSIKAFSGGQAFYQADDLRPIRRYLVEDSSYLILNHGQPYAITVDSPSPVESFCAFFPAGLAEEVQRSLTTRTDQLLDEPFGAELSPVHFFERTLWKKLMSFSKQ